MSQKQLIVRRNKQSYSDWKIPELFEGGECNFFTGFYLADFKDFTPWIRKFWLSDRVEQNEFDGFAKCAKLFRFPHKTEPGLQQTDLDKLSQYVKDYSLTTLNKFFSIAGIFKRGELKTDVKHLFVEGARIQISSNNRVIGHVIGVKVLANQKILVFDANYPDLEPREFIGYEQAAREIEQCLYQRFQSKDKAFAVAFNLYYPNQSLSTSLNRKKLLGEWLKKKDRLLLTDEKGFSFLHLAVKHGYNDVLEQIFAHPDYQTLLKKIKPEDILTLAIAKGDQTTLDLLLNNQNFCSNLKETNFYTYIYKEAIAQGQLRILKFAESKIDLNSSELYNMLSLSLSQKYEDIACHLFDKILPENSAENIDAFLQVLKIAIDGENEKWVSLLLQKNSILSSQNIASLLDSAMRLGNKNIIETLIGEIQKNNNMENSITLLESVLKNKCPDQLPSDLQNKDSEFEKNLINLALKISSDDTVIKLMNLFEKHKEYTLNRAIDLGRVGVVLEIMVLDKEKSKFEFEKILPIHRAAQYKNVNLFNKIIERMETADLLRPDNSGNTPLHIAIEYNSLEHVEAIKKILSVEEWELLLCSKNKEGFTPLNYAAYHGQRELISFLLGSSNKQDQLEISDQAGYLPIHNACFYGDIDQIKLLWKYYSQEKYKEFISPLYIAILTNHQDLVHFFLSEGLNSNEDEINNNSRILFAAIRTGNLNVVKLLLEKGCNPNQKDKNANTPLHIALNMGYEDIALALLDHLRIDVGVKNKQGRLPLEIAQHYNLEQAEKRIKILTKGIKKQPNIMQSAFETETEEVFSNTVGSKIGRTTERLKNEVKHTQLKRNPSSNEPDSRVSLSPLTVACLQGNIEQVKLLMNSNVTLESGYVGNEHVLEMLFKNNDEYLAYILINHYGVEAVKKLHNAEKIFLGGILNKIENGWENFAQLHAAQQGTLDTSNLDFSQFNFDKQLFMSYAASGGQNKMMTQLQSKGLSYSKADDEYKKTPLDYAKENDQKDTEVFLQTKLIEQELKDAFIEFQKQGHEWQVAHSGNQTIKINQKQVTIPSAIALARKHFDHALNQSHSATPSEALQAWIKAKRSIKNIFSRQRKAWDEKKNKSLFWCFPMSFFAKVDEKQASYYKTYGSDREYKLLLMQLQDFLLDEAGYQEIPCQVRVITTDKENPSIKIEKRLPIFADNVLKVIEKSSSGSLTWSGACEKIVSLLEKDAVKFKEHEPSLSIIQEAIAICNKVIIQNYRPRN